MNIGIIMTKAGGWRDVLLFCVFACSPDDSKMRINTTNYLEKRHKHDCTCPLLKVLQLSEGQFHEKKQKVLY